MCRFLRFVVEESLNGRESDLKESVIASAVFDRDGSYEPGNDPVVRVEARRLRAKLEEYYRSDGAAAAIVIKLPKGGYSPVYEQVESSPKRTRWKPVALAAAVIAAGVATWFGVGAIRDPRPASPSVAVLPFSNLSPQTEIGYFCDGLTEQLIDVISHLDGVRVPGRTSSFLFRGTNTDLKTIGAKLGVRHVVDGSVRKEGDRLRITAHLIAVDTGFQLWSQTYERKLSDLFALEDEISQAVANALRVRMTPKIQKRRTGNSEALRLYLLGRFYWYESRGNTTDLDRAVGYFEQAIQNDPGFAMAYASLARAYSRLEALAPDARENPFPKAKSAARRALEIDETSVEAVVALGVIKLFEWDWPGAEREFRLALTLDPKSAQAHGEYAFYLAAMGRISDAIEESALSLDLDPLSLAENLRHGNMLMYAHRLEEAAARFRKAAELEPKSQWPARGLGRVYLLMDKYPDALAQFAGNPLWTAITLASAGRLEEARKVTLPQLNNWVELAAYWSALGETEKALASLDKAYRARSTDLSSLKFDPQWASLRGQPRAQAVLKDMGIAGQP